MAIITISRSTKSGGADLAQKLSERLDYVCKSREVILDGARKYNIIAEELFHRLDETPSFWEKLTREHERYLIFVQCSVLDAVKDDNVVYHGSAGHLFLRGIEHVCRLRLDAPLEDRIKALMQETGDDHSQAEDSLNKIDSERLRWFKLIFGEQWRDPSLYDISFSTRHLSIDTIADIVASAIEHGAFSTTPDSQRKFENLYLESQVRAAFAADDRLWNLPVEIVASHGVVELKGMVKDAALRDALAETAGQVKGVTECRPLINLSTDRLTGGVYGHD